MTPEPFHFLRPWALLLAPLAALVWWWWRRRSDPMAGWRAQVDPELLAAQTDHGASGQRRRWPLLAAWLLATLALAGPSWRPEPSPFSEDVTPLVVLLKADPSMDTPDPEPSRIERAQLKIADLAQLRKGQPLGLIAYAGSAHLVLPPTRDTSVVGDMAKEISPSIMPDQGSRLDLAITRAAKLLDGGTLLVVTDSAVSVTPELTKAFADAGKPDVQILAISAPDAPSGPLEPLAKALDADLVPLSVDDQDVETIVRGAARPPVARDAEGTEIWQDDGYLLIPLLAALALLPFRREAKEEKPAHSSAPEP